MWLYIRLGLHILGASLGALRTSSMNEVQKSTSPNNWFRYTDINTSLKKTYRKAEFEKAGYNLGEKCLPILLGNTVTRV